MTPRPPRWRRAAAATLLAASLLAGGACAAASLRYCDEGAPLAAAQKDRLLRFAGLVKDELDRSGASVALVSRSGLDLDYFGHRYSHAGVSLRAHGDTPWAVRQLYFSCEERVPRLFDQGMSAFVLGMQRPERGYVSIVLLPAEAEASLARAAIDKRRALGLLAPNYSVNAHPFSTRYQNCNQWLVELIASAWSDTAPDDEPRRQAQRWLQEQGYAPSVMDVGWRLLMWAGSFITWVHDDDHPGEDLDRLRYQVSMPASIESFVHGRHPAARRIELCHDGHRVVLRRGWQPIADGCRPEAGDEVVALDN